MRLDRAATKLLALVSTVGVIGAITVTSAAPAGAATSTGPRSQAIVALAGDGAVSVPGLHVQSVLNGVDSEIVDGTAAQLAQLAATPGVVGVEANVTAHLESNSFGANDSSDSDGSTGSGSSGSSDGSGSSNGGTAPTVISPVIPPITLPTTAPGTTSDATSAGPLAPVPLPSVGVIASQTLGGIAGTPRAGRGITIALIDTGVADTAALNRASGRLVDAVDTSGLNTPNGKVQENGVFTDNYGHGTFMASLIAGGQVPGSGSNGLGVAPGATIDVVKVADADGNTSLAAVMAGLNWVATHSDQVDIANLSLSVDPPATRYGIDPLNFAVFLTRAAGVTVVVAAGNTPGVVGDPGFGPASLTVGAADTTTIGSPIVAPFSGFDNVDGVSKPDVVAAGVNILGEMPVGSEIDQEFPNARQPNGLFRGSGTSQSTAIVSGLAALYLQAHPSASPLQVKSAIRDSASSITSGKSDGQGLVSIPTGNYGSNDTGEQNLNLRQWFSTAPLWGNLFTGGAFDARRWSARRWSASGWDARRWASVTFDARLWSDVTFDARLWSARMWGSRMWGSRLWSASYWGDTA